MYFSHSIIPSAQKIQRSGTLDKICSDEVSCTFDVSLCTLHDKVVFVKTTDGITRHKTSNFVVWK